MVGINEIRPALEAILFAAGDSVETERIAKVLGAEPWDVRQAAEQPLLFCKLPDNLMISYIKYAEFIAGLNCRNSCLSSMLLMKFHKFCNINIRYAITISTQESLITYIFLNTLNSAACLCTQSCIHYCNAPRSLDLPGA